MRARGEREARGQQTARYEALAHLEQQRCSWQAPSLEQKVIYQMEMEVAWGEAEGEGIKKGTLRRLNLHGQNHTNRTPFGPCKKIGFHRLCFLKTEY